MEVKFGIARYEKGRRIGEPRWFVVMKPGTQPRDDALERVMEEYRKWRSAG